MTSILARVEALEGVFVATEDARIVIRVHDARHNATQRDPEREAVGIRANGIELARNAGESLGTMCDRAVEALGPLRRHSVPILSPVY